MRFVPYYTVSYHGKFYRAGTDFDIDMKDADFMSKHGDVIGEKPFEEDKTSQTANALIEQENPVRKAGRPRKNQ